MKKSKGALIKFLAECGHWMDCYALEPTPSQCPDCASRAVFGLWDGDLL